MTETIYYKKVYTYHQVLPEMIRHVCHQFKGANRLFTDMNVNVPFRFIQTLTMLVNDCTESIQQNYEQAIARIDLNAYSSTEQLLQDATTIAVNTVTTNVSNLKQSLHDAATQVDASSKQEYTELAHRFEQQFISKWTDDHIRQELQNVYRNVNKLNASSDHWSADIETWFTILFGARSNPYAKLIDDSIRDQLTDTAKEHYAAYNTGDESHEDHIQTVIRDVLTKLPLEQLIRDRAELVLEDGEAKQQFLASLPRLVQELCENEETYYNDYLNLVEQLHDERDHDAEYYTRL